MLTTPVRALSLPMSMFKTKQVQTFSSAMYFCRMIRGSAHFAKLPSRILMPIRIYRYRGGLRVLFQHTIEKINKGLSATVTCLN